MSGPVIIRLQNLPLEARSIDIRRFFEGLQIPDGGVHIIGGEKGDAFIAFHSDEDARQAMARDSMPLCNARIKLYLSSKTEMQNVISAARNQQLAAAAAAAAATTAAAPKATTLPSSIEQILFRSAQPVVTPKPPSTASNPAEILNNLTKLFSGGPSQSNAAAEQPKPVAQPAPKQDLDPILASILPIITQQKSAAGQGSSAINPSSFISSSASQQTAQQASSSSSAASKISINQLFDILQSHMKQSGPETTAPPKREPEYTEPQTRGNNGRDYQSYNQQRGGPVLGTAMPYRHGEPGIPGGQSSQAPPIKYATSSSSSSNLNGSNSPSQSSSATTSTGAAPSTTKLDPIIRVKNFAPAASYKEIRTFLQGVQIEHDGIKLLYDANGQKTGQAFVRLMGIIDLKKALCRNKQFYEDRQIEVLQSNEHEFATTNVVVEYPAMQRQRMLRQQQQQQQQPAEPKRSGSYQEPEQEMSGSPQNGFYLKIYGLPVSFDDQQLKAMFNNVKFVRIATSKPTPISTKIVNSDGSNENVTIVKAKKLCQVETQLDLERALTRQDERVGKSKVQIFQINKSEYDREMSSIPANRRPQYNNNNNGNSNYSNGGNNDDHNENDAEYMDTNETNDRDRDSRVRDYDAANENNNNGHGSNGGTNGSGESDVYIYMHGVPFSAREHEVKAFFPPAVQPRAVFFLIDAERLKNTGECLCEFASRYERDRALLKDGQLIRNRVITVRSISPGDFRQQLSQLEELREKLPKRGTRQPLLHTPQSNNEKPRLLSETLINLMKQQQANNPSSLKRSAPSSTTTNTSSQQKRIRSSPEPSAGSPPPNIVELPPLPPELQRHKKSIVLLSNVSFEATREDILELFRPYTPIEQTLKIRHDDQGQPTGDAIVACKNSDEAVKACSHLNGSNFMGRNIRAVMLEP